MLSFSSGSAGGVVEFGSFAFYFGDPFRFGASLFVGDDATFEEFVHEAPDFAGAAADQTDRSGSVAPVAHFAVEAVHEDVDQDHLVA